MYLDFGAVITMQIVRVSPTLSLSKNTSSADLQMMMEALFTLHGASF